MMNKRSTVLLLALIGCGSPKRVDVGDEQREVTSELSSYVEEWDGYAESYEFAGDGEDRVRITINADGTGTFRGGTEALFGNATDPEGFYPPTYGGTYPNETRSLHGFRSGFEYPLHDVRVSDDRLQFRINANEIMNSWCAIQPMMDQGWTCAPFDDRPTLYMLRDENDQLHCYLTTPGEVDTDSTSVPIGEIQAEVSCIVMNQCERCVCDQDGCTAYANSFIEVDAALSNDGDSLEGTMQLDEETRVTLRLKRPE